MKGCVALARFVARVAAYEYQPGFSRAPQAHISAESKLRTEKVSHGAPATVPHDVVKVTETDARIPILVNHMDATTVIGDCAHVIKVPLGRHILRF